MLIACISDIHGNLPALEAAVADARARGAEMICCAGDLTGYGPFPREVCLFLEERGIPTIMGNYDRKVIEAAEGKAARQVMKEGKRRILLWTVENTKGAGLGYLKRLPESLDLDLFPGQRSLIVHGSPVSPDDPIYPSVTKPAIEGKLGGNRPAILVCGHTHIPFVKKLSGLLVVNCGSAGYPVDGDPRPSYALLRNDRGANVRGTIVRFPYDRGRTIGKLRNTGLPRGLSEDFALGNKNSSLDHRGINQEDGNG